MRDVPTMNLSVTMSFSEVNCVLCLNFPLFSLFFEELQKMNKLFLKGNFLVRHSLNYLKFALIGGIFPAVSVSACRKKILHTEMSSRKKVPVAMETFFSRFNSFANCLTLSRKTFQKRSDSQGHASLCLCKATGRCDVTGDAASSHDDVASDAVCLDDNPSVSHHVRTCSRLWALCWQRLLTASPIDLLTNATNDTPSANPFQDGAVRLFHVFDASSTGTKRVTHPV